MKTPIAIALIVMGALLVMTPALADLFYQRNIVTVMAKSGVMSVSLDGKMSEIYRFGCWLTGSGMVLVAVLSSLSGRGTVKVGEERADAGVVGSEAVRG